MSHYLMLKQATHTDLVINVSNKWLRYKNIPSENLHFPIIVPLNCFVLSIDHNTDFYTVQSITLVLKTPSQLRLYSVSTGEYLTTLRTRILSPFSGSSSKRRVQSGKRLLTFRRRVLPPMINPEGGNKNLPLNIGSRQCLTRHNVPEDLNLHQHSWGNIKSPQTY